MASLSKARTQWDQRRVAILGAARQGLALAHYLLEKGARVILNDARPEDQLGVALESFSDLGAQRKDNLNGSSAAILLAFWKVLTCSVFPVVCL